ARLAPADAPAAEANARALLEHHRAPAAHPRGETGGARLLRQGAGGASPHRICAPRRADAQPARAGPPLSRRARRRGEAAATLRSARNDESERAAVAVGAGGGARGQARAAQDLREGLRVAAYTH